MKRLTPQLSIPMLNRFFKTQLFLFALAFGFVEIAFAQNTNILYAVQKEGYKTSYLFGTLHLIPEDKIYVSDALLGALNQSDELVLEADAFGAMMADVMQYAMLPNGGTLDTALSEDDLALLDSALQASAGVGLQALITVKPFIIDAMLMAGAAPQNAQAWERILTDSVTANNKPISYLETIAQQLCFFDSIPVRFQLAQTLAYLHEEGGMQAEYQKLLGLYLSGDVDALNSYMTESITDPKYLYFLLEKRNRAWIPQLMAGMKTKRLFIAVGAGHLPGETGVIELLRKEGFVVERVE
jgi:uncharacterized protein YbaP (TraB family)